MRGLAGTFPDAATLESALDLAGYAPSARNSQPWRWHVDRDAVHLSPDWTRSLGDADFDRRDVLLSCGAVLNHCVVAFAAAGYRSHVRRFPGAGVLASLEMAEQAPGAGSIELAEAIPRRRADRRRFLDRPIPEGTLELLQIRAEQCDVRMAVVPRLRWGRGVEEEMALGYPASSSAHPDDDAVLVALGTDTDTDPTRLRAGEALSHVTLSAAALGLATCPVTAPLRDVGSRLALACEVFDGDAYPQALIRLGWPPVDDEPLAPAERRSVAETTTWAD